MERSQDFVSKYAGLYTLSAVVALAYAKYKHMLEKSLVKFSIVFEVAARLALSASLHIDKRSSFCSAVSAEWEGVV